MNAPWYSLAQLPAGRVHVRVTWGAWVIEAARILWQGRYSWAVPGTFSAGNYGAIVWLPSEPMSRNGCGPEPDCWQPLDEATFPWPGGVAPEPLAAEIRPGLRHIRDARNGPQRAPERPEPGPSDEDKAGLRPGSRWWQEVPQFVTYAAAGAPVSPHEVEGRVCRALLTIAVLDDPERRFLLAAERVNWPATWDSAEEQRWQRENHDNLDPKPSRFEPRKADITDARENGAPLKWFARLNPPQLRPKGAPAGYETGLQRIVRGHAYGDSWRKLGTQSKADYGKALEALHRIANGWQPFPHVTIRDELADLKARNRAHRNRG